MRYPKILTPLPLLLLLVAGCGGDTASQPAATASTPAATTTGSNAAASGSTAAPDAAGGVPATSDLPAELVARAGIPVEQARRTARGRLPGATISAEELEDEGGRLIYSFEMTTAGAPGIDEVNVDAADGSLIGVQHEGPAQERAEQLQDEQAAAAAKAGQ